MAYLSTDPQLAARELEVQEVVVKASLTAGTSDLASNILINNSTIAATTITFSASENIKTCYAIQVKNRVTGAIVATTAAPDVSVAKKATVTVNGTGISDCVITVKYSVAQ